MLVTFCIKKKKKGRRRGKKKSYNNYVAQSCLTGPALLFNTQIKQQDKMRDRKVSARDSGGNPPPTHSFP